MAKLGINTGITANDGTGDTLREAGGKINTNFDEVYSAIGDGLNLYPGIVTSITAGNFISISTSFGDVTITGLANTENINAESLIVTGISTVGMITSTDTMGIGTIYSQRVEVVGAVIANSLSGDGSAITGLATTEFVSTKTLVVSGVSTLGIITGATSIGVDDVYSFDVYANNFHGDGSNITVVPYSLVAAAATYSSVAGISTTSQGLTGSPDVVVGIITGTTGNFTSLSASTGLDLSDNANVSFGDGNDYIVDYNGTNAIHNVATSGAIVFQQGGTNKFKFDVGSAQIIPTSNNTGRVGTPDKTWNGGHFTDFNVDGIITVGIITGASSVQATYFYGDATYLTGVGFATVSGIATFATSAGVATYAVSAGIATYADSAGIATNATFAGYATLAGVSTTSGYASLAGVATYSSLAGVATYATNAGVATYSPLAGVSTYATNAGVATYATSAGISTNATYAGYATLAGVSTTSGYATNAGVATYATLAGVSTYATNAGISTNATFAGYATLAGVSTTSGYATNAGVATYAGVSGISTVSENLTGNPSIAVTSVTSNSLIVSGISTLGVVTGVTAIASTTYYGDGSNLTGVTKPIDLLDLRSNTLSVTGVSTLGIVTGVTEITATTYYGDGSNLTGVSKPSDLNDADINSLVVSGVSTLGIVTGVTEISATTYYGDGTNLTGVARTDDIRADRLVVTGISTLGIVTGVTSIEATTYYGDGTNLTGVARTDDIRADRLVVTGISTLGVVNVTSITGDGSNLTGIANTINTVSETLVVSGVSTLGVVNVTSISGDGSGLTGVTKPDDLVDMNINSLVVAGISTLGIVTATAYFGAGGGLTGVTKPADLNDADINSLVVAGITTLGIITEATSISVGEVYSTNVTATTVSGDGSGLTNVTATPEFQVKLDGVAVAGTFSSFDFVYGGEQSTTIVASGTTAVITNTTIAATANVNAETLVVSGVSNLGIVTEVTSIGAANVYVTNTLTGSRVAISSDLLLGDDIKANFGDFNDYTIDFNGIEGVHNLKSAELVIQDSGSDKIRINPSSISITPETDDTGSVGSPTNNWNNGHFTNLTVGAAITVGVVTGATYYGDGSNLTGITDNIRATTLAVTGVSTLGVVTGATYYGDGSALTGVVKTSELNDANINSLVVAGISTLGIVTGVESIGVGTVYATSLIGDGSGLTGVGNTINTVSETLVVSGVSTLGIVTVTSISGDGSGLTGVGNTIDTRSETLVVSGVSTLGIVTVTSISGDGSGLTGIAVTENVSTNSLVVTGISTLGVVTVTSISGDGSGLTGVGKTINTVSETLVVSGVSTLGVVTGATYFGDGTNLTGVARTDDIRADRLVVTGISTLGVVTVTSISGDGSNLTGVTKPSDLNDANINSIVVSGVSTLGVVNVTSVSGDGSGLTGVAATENVSTNSLVVTGVSTLGVITGASSIDVTDVYAANLSGIGSNVTGVLFATESSYSSTSGVATVSQGLTGFPDVGVSTITGIGATFLTVKSSIIQVDQEIDITGNHPINFGDNNEYSIIYNGDDAIHKVSSGNIGISSDLGTTIEIDPVSASIFPEVNNTGSIGTEGKKWKKGYIDQILSGVVTASIYYGDGSQITGVVKPSDLNELSPDTLVVTGVSTLGVVSVTSISGDGSSLTGLVKPNDLNLLDITRLTVSGISTLGIVTGATYFGDGSNLTGVTKPGELDNLNITNLNVVGGISTLGVVTGATYFGDGSALTGVNHDISYWTSAQVGNVGVVTTSSVGVGTLIPESAAHPDNVAILNAGIVTAREYYGDGSNLTGVFDGVTISKETFSVTGIQTTFVLQESTYQPGYIDVYQNGQYLSHPDDYSYITNTTFALVSAASTGDVVSTLVYVNGSVSSGIGVTLQVSGDSKGIAGTINFDGNFGIDVTDGIGTISIGTPILRPVEFANGIAVSGGITTVGIITAETYFGDGSNLTGLGTATVSTNSLNVQGVTTTTNIIEVRSDDSAPARIDYYCEVSNAHYTRVQAAPHSEYSGNAVVTLPTVDGELLVGNTDTPTDQNINTTGIITASSFKGNFNADDVSIKNLNVSGLSTLGVVTNTTDVSYAVNGRWTLEAEGTENYVFSGIGLTEPTPDPVIYLQRGAVYEFDNQSGGAHPFVIRRYSQGGRYDDGVTGNATAVGIITFMVPFSAPNTLYYQCNNHAGMGNTIRVFPDLI